MAYTNGVKARRKRCYSGNRNGARSQTNRDYGKNDLNKPHLNAVDAIRFLAAVTVVFHHLPRPPFIHTHFYKYLFFGSSAVVVFFVISGLCIHINYIGKQNINWKEYYLRRYIRLLVPLATIIFIGYLADASYHPYKGWVTWSLICEAVYYAIYPVLRTAWDKFGWKRVIAISYIASFAILGLTVESTSFLVFAVRDTISFLPVWILGAYLAETIASGKKCTINNTKIRWLTVGISMLLAILHYKAGIQLRFTMPGFGLLAALWLWSEISSKQWPKFLQKAGAWSYSLYLMHPTIYVLFLSQYGFLYLSKHTEIWTSAIACIGVASYVFYKIVEEPSHRLARSI